VPWFDGKPIVHEGIAAFVGAAEASSPNIPPDGAISAVVVGSWTASIAAPAASTPSSRCPTAAGCALEVVGRQGGGESAMVSMSRFRRK
jgi:hypothetical protein